MRKFNLLHIIPALPKGGAEFIIYTLAKKIDKKKFNLIVCCLYSEGEIAEKIKKEGLADVYCLKEDRPRDTYLRIPLSSLFRQMVKLCRLMKRERVDIVHTHLLRSDFWGRIVALAAGVPIICKTEHAVRHPKKFGIWDTGPRSGDQSRMKRLGIDLLLDWRTKAIVYNTNYARKSFLGERINPEKHFVVPGAQSKEILTVSDSRKMLRRKLGFSNEDFLIIIVARFIERKGHKYLLEAFGKLSPIYQRMKLLVIVSNGDLSRSTFRQDLEKLAIQLNIASKTLFICNVDSVRQYIKMSDVLVLPSWKESLGLVLLESMYLGVPVIGGDDAGIPEVIDDGVDGYLVKIRNSKSIEKAILKIITEPEKTKRMIENAREKFERKFSEEVFIKKYEKIYISLLQKKR